MGITLQPDALRRAWRHGAAAADELDRARRHTAGAAGGPGQLAGLADLLAESARDLDGALRVAGALVDEHGAGLAACVADFEATDGASAGRFHGLVPGPAS